MTAATRGAQPLDASFTASIEKDGAFATYLELPGSDDLLGTRRAVKVAGTIDGHPFAATLMPSGKGPIGCLCGQPSARSSGSPRPARKSPYSCSSDSADHGPRLRHVLEAQGSSRPRR